MNPLLRPERGFLDHALAGIGCAAAGLAIGFSLNTPSFALFLGGLTAVSTILGYLLARAFRRKNVAALGTWLWVIISITCFFLVRPLNNALPGQPFEFKTMIGATDGNLSVHARKLEDAGYVSCEKTFSGRTPRTAYTLTASGRRALEKYLDHMEAIIRSARHS